MKIVFGPDRRAVLIFFESTEVRTCSIFCAPIVGKRNEETIDVVNEVAIKPSHFE